MTKPKVFIYISDVASLIGQNKWDCSTPFERLWKKCDLNGYNKVIEQVNAKIEETRVDIIKIECEKEKLSKELSNNLISKQEHNVQMNKLECKRNILKQELEDTETKTDDIKLTQQLLLEKVVGKTVVEELSSVLTKTKDKHIKLNAVIDSLELDNSKAEAIKKHGQSYINKAHGTNEEASAIELFESKFNVKLDTSQQFHKLYLKNVSKTSAFDWYICGKVDGLYNDNEYPQNSYIVEVKNRTKAFFSNLRDYEKTQIYLYMTMLNISKSKLVEKYNKKIKVTDIVLDNEYETDILDYLDIFISNFESNFVNNDVAKTKYLTLSKDERILYIKRTFFAPITSFINKRIQDKLDIYSDLECENCLID